MSATCPSCAWWAESHHDRRLGCQVGQCRRNAPRVVELDGRPLTRWPLTRESQGCGEQRPAR